MQIAILGCQIELLIALSLEMPHVFDGLVAVVSSVGVIPFWSLLHAVQRHIKQITTDLPTLHQRLFGAASEWTIRCCKWQHWKKSLAKHKYDFFELWCQGHILPKRGESARTCAREGSRAGETLGHIDLLLVFSRRSLWEGSFEVALKNSSQRALWRRLLRKRHVEGAGWSMPVSCTVATVSRCDALAFSRPSSYCKTGKIERLPAVKSHYWLSPRAKYILDRLHITVVGVSLAALSFSKFPSFQACRFVVLWLIIVYNGCN